MSTDSGQDKLRPVIIAFNAVIYVMFVVLLVVYFVIKPPSAQLSCTAGGVLSGDPRSYVAIAFKVSSFLL